MSRILFLEDDAILGKNLKLYLSLKGFDVVWVTDIQKARSELAKNSTDLCIFDWNLPSGTGFDFFQSIELVKRPPTIFLTSRLDEESAIQALREGALDYLRKPFGQGELLVKIKKALHEARAPLEVLKFSDLILDLNLHKAFIGEVEISLRRREFSILEILVRKSDQIVTREEILATIDKDADLNDRSIDSHLSRIRQAIHVKSANVGIESVYGIGYRMKKLIDKSAQKLAEKNSKKIKK